MPTVCIVGRSGTGKTMFIERLIPELKGRGYHIAVIKHTHEAPLLCDQGQFTTVARERVMLSRRIESDKSRVCKRCGHSIIGCAKALDKKLFVRVVDV